ncbi:MAG: hypothetical protein K6G60_10630 [Lachnospiraceae bacterium]|nr:hypothetical protein [Lachnospiraceae bacterium]
MKKENLVIFLKMLIVYCLISAVAFFIIFILTRRIPWLDVICDVVVGVFFAAIITGFCKLEEKETTDENVLEMFKRYNLKVNEKDGCLIGKFGGIRRLYYKDIEYKRGSNRIIGPKNIISKYCV